MREVGQGIALAIEVLALAVDEGIDALGQRLQFARVGFAHAGGRAGLHALELADHVAQRAQAPAQHQHLQQQQDHAGAAKVAPQRRAERGHLATERGGVLEDVDGVRELAACILAAAEHQAIAIAVHLPELAADPGHRQRPFEHLLPRVQHARGRQPGALRGIRFPLAGRQHDLRVQAAAGALEAGIGRVVRRDHAAVAGEIACGVGQRVTVQALAHAAARGALEGEVQRIAGQCQETDQAQAGRPQLARLQRTWLGDTQTTAPCAVVVVGCCGSGRCHLRRLDQSPLREHAVNPRSAGSRNDSRGRARSRSASSRRPDPASCAGGR